MIRDEGREAIQEPKYRYSVGETPSSQRTDKSAEDHRGSTEARPTNLRLIQRRRRNYFCERDFGEQFAPGFLLAVRLDFAGAKERSDVRRHFFATWQWPITDLKIVIVSRARLIQRFDLGRVGQQHLENHFLIPGLACCRMNDVRGARKTFPDFFRAETRVGVARADDEIVNLRHVVRANRRRDVFDKKLARAHVLVRIEYVTNAMLRLDALAVRVDEQRVIIRQPTARSDHAHFRRLPKIEVKITLTRGSRGCEMLLEPLAFRSFARVHVKHTHQSNHC